MKLVLMKVLLLQNYIYRYRSVFSMTVTGGLITVTNHELSNGNAVMFTGSGTMPTGLFKNKTYYVSEVTTATQTLSKCHLQ